MFYRLNRFRTEQIFEDFCADQMVNILIDCPRADRGPKFLMITVFFFRLVARPIHLSVGESERKVTQADFF